MPDLSSPVDRVLTRVLSQSSHKEGHQTRVTLAGRLDLARELSRGGSASYISFHITTSRPPFYVNMCVPTFHALTALRTREHLAAPSDYLVPSSRT